MCILMGEGNKRIIQVICFYLPRACLIGVESEAFVSTGDLVLYLPNQPYMQIFNGYHRIDCNTLL